ncbi:MAG: TolC family protein [Nitrospirota bacterium]
MLRKHIKKILFFSFLLSFIYGFPSGACGDVINIYSLEEFIKMAVKFSPQIKEMEQEVEMAKTRLQEAEGYQWPQIEVTALSGPAPRARGDQIHSDYRNDRLSGIGIFGNVEVKIVQPIYTFGKITESKKAATHGIMVDESRVQQKAADIAVEIKKYYYGYLASLEGRKLVNEIDGYLDKAIERTKKLLGAESAYVTELDLYKLESYKGLLAKYAEETNKNIIMSKEALRTFAGIDKDAEFELKDRTLEPVEVKPESLGFYINKSRELRPEFAQLREGIEAKKALVDVADADFYPDIFAAAFYSYAEATERDKVTNPWIHDYFRHNVGGVVLGLKWDIDFGITKARYRRAKADHLKYERLRDYANIGIPLEVEKTYRELLEEKKNIEATGTASGLARKWMVGAVMNYDMGIGESRDVADAIVAYGKMAEEYIKSVYNYNMNYANLLQTSGLSIREIPGKY